MNQLQTGKAPLVAAAGKENPDVIVTRVNQTTLFAPQNHRASDWLHLRCGLATENMSGDTEIRVHPRKCRGVITELKAAGFVVAGEREELC